ncbi:hypothetical protein Pmani_020715 [Petrolisthes manimaculis]|uniref:Non-canonical purine NTP phosphatase/PRRC1 domain-containing protein n=1 Tax=Petrolisthes manimaculis TaxID=1843537 RepID=A0AAE1PH65_9EUCA|nr:hypothetical protein Pmani_020715 [Petrolisthes manimaculis]
MTSLLVADGSGSSSSSSVGVGAGGSSSVLTNVSPPSALPSFLASPLPAPTAPTTITSPFPPPTTTTPHVPPMSSGHPVLPPGVVPSPTLGTRPIRPPGGSPIPPPGSIPVRAPITSPIPPSGSSMSGPLPPQTFPPPPMSSGLTQAPGSPFPPPPVSSGPMQSTALGQPAYSPVVTGVAGPPPPQSTFTSQSPITPSPVTSQPQPPHSGVDQSAAVDLGVVGAGSPHAPDGTAGPGWFGWIRGTVSHVGHRVAERAKTSMDTMITTLDPQMKEFIHSGGDMDIVVASDKEVKVGAVREAFQIMFGKATVSGMASQVEGVAAQPVGFEAALRSAEERINFLRCSGKIHPQQPIVAVENFIVELTPDCWYDLGVLLLDDPGEDIILQTYTQVTPVPPDFVKQAQSSTPSDYPHRNTGLATTVGQIASQQLQVHHTLWQETLTGVSRRELVVLAARTLAGLYRSRLPRIH